MVHAPQIIKTKHVDSPKHNFCYGTASVTKKYPSERTIKLDNVTFVLHFSDEDEFFSELEKLIDKYAI